MTKVLKTAKFEPKEKPKEKPPEEKDVFQKKATELQHRIKVAKSVIDFSGFGITAENTDDENLALIIPFYADFYLEEGLLPISRKEKYAFFRFFYKHDVYGSSAIDIHTEIPLSKVKFSWPKRVEAQKELFDRARGFYEDWIEEVSFFHVLVDMVRDYNLMGDVFIFPQRGNLGDFKCYEKIIFLPPNMCDVKETNFSADKLLTIQMDEEQVPDTLKNVVKDGKLTLPIFDKGDPDKDFIFHFARNKLPYETYGTSMFESCLKPFFTRLKLYRIRGLDITRNTNPVNVITAPKASEEQLLSLEDNVEMSEMQVSAKVYANYEINWERIGVGEGLYDLSADWEQTKDELMIGLMTTQDMLSGGQTYSGGRITLEVVNRRYLMLREKLIDVTSRVFFKSMAVMNDFFYEEDDGRKVYVYPKLGFKRLPLRDDESLFANVFNLYQKGSAPVDLIYELLGLDADEINEQLVNDLLTIKDPTFNSMLQEIYSSVVEQVVEKTNVLETIIAGFGKVKFQGPSPIKTAPSEEVELDEVSEESPDELPAEEPVDEEVVEE